MDQTSRRMAVIEVLNAISVASSVETIYSVDGIVPQNARYQAQIPHTVASMWGQSVGPGTLVFVASQDDSRFCYAYIRDVYANGDVLAELIIPEPLRVLLPAIENPWLRLRHTLCTAVTDSQAALYMRIEHQVDELEEGDCVAVLTIAALLGITCSAKALQSLDPGYSKAAAAEREGYASIEQFRQLLQEARTAADSANAFISDVEHERDALAEQLAHKRDQLREVSSQIQRVGDKAEAATAAASAAKKGEAAAKRQLEEATAARAGLEAQLVASKAATAQTRRALDEASSKLEELGRATTEANAKATAALARAKSAEKGAADEGETARSMQAENAAMQTEIAGLQADVSRLNAQLATATAEVARLKRAAIDAREKYTDAARKDIRELEEAKCHAQELLAKCAEETARADAAEQRAHHFELRLQARTENEKELAELQAELHELRTRCSKAEHAVKSAREVAEDADSKAKSLGSQLKAAELRIANYELELRSRAHLTDASTTQTPVRTPNRTRHGTGSPELYTPASRMSAAAYRRPQVEDPANALGRSTTSSPEAIPPPSRWRVPIPSNPIAAVTLPQQQPTKIRPMAPYKTRSESVQVVGFRPGIRSSTESDTSSVLSGLMAVSANERRDALKKVDTNTQQIINAVEAAIQNDRNRDLQQTQVRVNIVLEHFEFYCALLSQPDPVGDMRSIATLPAQFDADPLKVALAPVAALAQVVLPIARYAFAAHPGDTAFFALTLMPLMVLEFALEVLGDGRLTAASFARRNVVYTVITAMLGGERTEAKCASIDTKMLEPPSVFGRAFVADKAFADVTKVKSVHPPKTKEAREQRESRDAPTPPSTRGTKAASPLAPVQKGPANSAPAFAYEDQSTDNVQEPRQATQDAPAVVGASSVGSVERALQQASDAGYVELLYDGEWRLAAILDSRANRRVVKKLRVRLFVVDEDGDWAADPTVKAKWFSAAEFNEKVKDARAWVPRLSDDSVPASATRSSHSNTPEGNAAAIAGEVFLPTADASFETPGQEPLSPVRGTPIAEATARPMPLSAHRAAAAGEPAAEVCAGFKTGQGHNQPCRANPIPGFNKCAAHLYPSSLGQPRCCARTTVGNRPCAMRAADGFDMCAHHIVRTAVRDNTAFPAPSRPMETLPPEPLPVENRHATSPTPLARAEPEQVPRASGIALATPGNPISTARRLFEVHTHHPSPRAHERPPPSYDDTVRALWRPDQPRGPAMNALAATPQASPAVPHPAQHRPAPTQWDTPTSLAETGPFHRGGGSLVPALASLQRHHLRYLTAASSNRVAAGSRLGFVSNTHANHVRWLRRIGWAAIQWPESSPDYGPLPQQLPAVNFICAVADNWRVSRHIKATSYSTLLGAIAGAFAALPVYLPSVPFKVSLADSPLWTNLTHAVNLEALSEGVTQAPPASPDHVFKACETACSPQLAGLIALSWVAASRPGDVAQLKKMDVVARGSTLEITFRRGKTVRLTGAPYTVMTEMGPFEQWIAPLLNNTAEEHFIWFCQDPTQRPRLIADLTECLRAVDPSLSCRSLRRGALQAMAKNGVPAHVLMTFSGHSTVQMLKRYLGFGIVLRQESDPQRLAAATHLARPPPSATPYGPRRSTTSA